MWYCVAAIAFLKHISTNWVDSVSKTLASVWACFSTKSRYRNQMAIATINTLNLSFGSTQVILDSSVIQA
jgi:hypothetical protein